MLAEMPLNELRQTRGLYQKMLADVLHVHQPSIAKIEKRADKYIYTLRSHIEAMGVELEVVARFSDGNVKISNFSDIAGPATSCLPVRAESRPCKIMNSRNKRRLNIPQPKVSCEMGALVEASNEPSETEYLLKSHDNALHLARSIEQLRIGLVQA
jgi:hypothetical protein